MSESSLTNVLYQRFRKLWCSGSQYD